MLKSPLRVKRKDQLLDLHNFDPCADARWQRFLERRSDASVFHTVGWLEALRRTYDYEPVVYTTSAPAAEIREALLFCRINTWLSGRRLVSVPFSDHAALLVDADYGLQRLLSLVQEEAGAKSCKYIEIRPATDLSSNLVGLEQSAVFSWHKLALDEGLDAIYRSFHKNCIQRKIRRAEREGLEYKEGGSEELIQQFYDLLLLTHRRHGLPPQPISWFRNLNDCLGDMFTIRVASKNGVPIASIITLTYKQSMIYKYGASDARYHNLGGMPFLFWRAIQDATRSGLKEVDMGRSNCTNTGLVSFKERLGAQANKLVYWTYPGKSRPDPNRWDVRAARSIFALLPTAILSATGRLLYRHIG